MKILHLTLIKKYFDQIASGKKKQEYREFKPYWIKRLTDLECDYYYNFDEIHFRNGYSKNAPFMRIEHLGTFHDKFLHCFVIELGKILEIKNWVSAG